MRLGIHTNHIPTADNRRLAAERDKARQVPVPVPAAPDSVTAQAVRLAVAETKLECAGKIVEMFLNQARTGDKGAGSCETPGSGPSQPTPIANPFADFFKVQQ